jgi:hypothetical protein
VPFLHLLNAEYEKELEERRKRPYDVRRMTPPRLILVFPKPNARWKHVTLSDNSLYPFPLGYIDQLKLIYKVFNQEAWL